METRAHHLVVGIFVLLFVGGILGFVIWLTSAQVNREFTYYDILFTDSVAGLGVGGDVRFNGIKVGEVQKIVIDREDPSRVRVTVAVAPDTPVRKDSLATLQLQGITGVSFVQIFGGTNRAPLLAGSTQPPYPLIPSQPSRIAELLNNAPQLINGGVEVLARLSAILDDQNRQNLAGTMADIRQLTQVFAQRADRIDHMLEQLAEASGDVAQVAKQSTQLAQHLDRLMDEMGATMSVARGALSAVDQLVDGEVRGTAASAGRLTSELAGIVEENRDSIRNFTGDGLLEFRRFLEEARQLVGSLSRVATRIGEDPSTVIFGTRETEIKPEVTR
ncbi:MAG: MCE family protein [Proteobacteria bacterium]|nr:MCE family protein [Pseudomonadota bacterium]